MVEYSYLLIIIIGSTALFVVLYYNALLKKLLKVLSQLLKLQESNFEDMKLYITSIETTLHPIGVFKIDYDIRYSKKRVSSLSDNTQGTLLKKSIYYKNIDGYLAIYVKNNRGENRIINKLILYVLTLQITNAIHSDIAKINESFEKIAKLQTYMMHDLKNILQYFQAMQYNLEHLNSEEEEKRFIEFLQNSTQPINTKVNKILSLLQVKSNINPDAQKKTLHLKELFLEYIDFLKLNCILEGDAAITVNENLLRTLIDNILTNIHDKLHEDRSIRCLITIGQKGDTILIEITDTGYPFKNPDEVIEPFYTTKEEGIGIGMYQVATIIDILHGSIVCTNKNNHPHILITL
jgi:signal transduction histidine kinase